MRKGESVECKYPHRQSYYYFHRYACFDPRNRYRYILTSGRGLLEIKTISTGISSNFHLFKFHQISEIYNFMISALITRLQLTTVP